MTTPNGTAFDSSALAAAMERINKADALTRRGVLTPLELYEEINKERVNLGYPPLTDVHAWLRRWL